MTHAGQRFLPEAAGGDLSIARSQHQPARSRQATGKSTGLQPQAAARPNSRPGPSYRQEAERLRQQLVRADAELDACRHKVAWLESALAAQRHGRQVLEAAVAARYPESVRRVLSVVRAKVPPGATVLVVSKGDQELLKLDGLQAWHFPRGDNGEYAGYYPADSNAAIDHLQKLITQGARFLLFPSTSYWWLEHYRGLAEHLDRIHHRVWHDDQCALYRLSLPESRDQMSGQPLEGTASLPDLRLNGVMQLRSSVDRLDGDPHRTSSPADHPDVLCFPIINWDYRFQRPQQLMSRFAAAGHRVFYLSHEFRNSGDPCVERRLAGNLYEVSLRGPRFKLHQGVLDEDACEALFVSLSALHRRRSLDAAIAMVQLAFWWPLVNLAATSFQWPVIYDCMDYHAGFSTSHPLSLDQERELLSQANLVVASSATLEAAALQHNRNVLLIRNGCEYTHFSKVPYKPPAAQPVIGYYGAIAEWFDADLVAELAERRPDWNFILVGSTVHGEVSRLSKLQNVSLPGEKPYAELPGWLARFDVTILPFKRTPLTEAVNPVKAYEILAAGKPLVSVPLTEVLGMVPHVRLASTAQEFEREIMTELGRSGLGAFERRRAFARANTWEQRFTALASVIPNAILRKESQIQHAVRAVRVRSA
jgi:glycosyltransferase involved in cell wall biosynthesis